MRAVSFSADWGAPGGVKEWIGFYIVIDGKNGVVGKWVRRQESNDPELDRQLEGKETFGRQGR